MSKNRVARASPAIEARGLVKVYGEHRALDRIDLTVRRGQVFGFLGPNGAGKTTTIRVLDEDLWATAAITLVFAPLTLHLYRKQG